MSKYAFPSAHDPKTGVAQIGMTLRDYLAAAALQGLIARGVNPESIPRQAYEYADKMLKERDETPRHSNLVDGDNVNP
jgi:hypothetical protein